jgi:hypothetical protein
MTAKPLEQSIGQNVQNHPEKKNWSWGFISGVPDTYNISNNGVVEVVGRVPCAPDYVEIMPM